MKEVFDVKDKFGNTIGSIETREVGIFRLLAYLVLSLILVAGFVSLIYFIWPLCYKTTLPYFEKGDQSIMIATYTTIGGIILGCFGSIIWTIKHRIIDRGVNGKIGMGETIATGIRAAAIGCFGASFGITAITAIIYDIITGRFNFLGLLILIPLAIVIALLSIFPVILTVLLDSVIALIHDIVTSIIRKKKV